MNLQVPQQVSVSDKMETGPVAPRLGLQLLSRSGLSVGDKDLGLIPGYFSLILSLSATRPFHPISGSLAPPSGPLLCRVLCPRALASLCLPAFGLCSNVSSRISSRLTRAPASRRGLHPNKRRERRGPAPSQAGHTERAVRAVQADLTPANSLVKLV